MTILILEGNSLSFSHDGKDTNTNLLTPIDIFKNEHLLFMCSVVGWQ
jgi:hypothetical protein